MEAARHPSPRRLGELLVEHGLLSEQELEQVLAEQALTGRRLGEIAVARGLVSGPSLTAVLAEQLGVDLETEGGFGSGLWIEIARRHERGLGDLPEPTARGLDGRQRSQVAPAGSEPLRALALKLVGPDSDAEEVSTQLARLSAEIADLRAGEERAQRELAEARIALALALEVGRRTQREEAPAPGLVLHVPLDGGFALLADRPARSLERVEEVFPKQPPLEARRLRSAPPQDPVFGLHHETLAERLTRSNWREKAVLRGLRDGTLLYVWLTRVGRSYRMNVRDDPSFEATFPRLADALAAANGQRGPLARRTHAVPRAAWPPDHDVVVVCFPVLAPAPE